MSRNIVVYEPSGQIRQVQTCDDVTFDAITRLSEPFPGAAWVEALAEDAPFSSYPLLHFVQDGGMVSRQEMSPNIDKTTIAADGVDVATITGFPVPCVMTVSGALQAGPVDVDDGVIEISCDSVGSLTIRVTAEPQWLPWSVVIYAT